MTCHLDFIFAKFILSFEELKKTLSLKFIEEQVCLSLLVGVTILSTVFI